MSVEGDHLIEVGAKAVYDILLSRIVPNPPPWESAPQREREYCRRISTIVLGAVAKDNCIGEETLQ